MEPGDGELVLIGWAYGTTDMGFVQAVFDAADVPVFFHGGPVHATLTHAAVAMGGARVMVFTADRDEARALLTTCLFDPAPRLRWGRIALVAALSLIFSWMPMPYRAVAVRDDVEPALPG